MLRLPDGLRERVKGRATANGRSINTEIIAAIERHLDCGDRLSELEMRVRLLERRLVEGPSPMTGGHGGWRKEL